MKKSVWIIIVILIVASLVAVRVKRMKEKTNAPLITEAPVAINTAVVSEDSVIHIRHVLGTVVGANEADVAPRVMAQVMEIRVREGDAVRRGDVLVVLDARELEDAVAQAEAARDGAYQAWQDIIAIRDNPQELNAQIAQVRAQVAAAEAGLGQATALKDAAEIGNDAFQKGMEALAEAQEELEKIPEPYRPTLPGMQLNAHLIPNAYWKSWVGVNTAQAGLDGARAALSNLYAMRNNPQELNGQVDAAETQYRVTEAAVQMAQAQLDALRAGATEEEIAAVEAQVEQAQAALDALMVLRDKLTIAAPAGGLVLERCIHEGELAAPGATLLTLGDLDEVTLTIYVPEDGLGQVHVGQQVEVRVDSFPERTFAGTVVAIAHEAEFTPRNVQTQEERVNMVFAVDVSIPNPDHALKPGLPADATIITEEQ